MGTPIILYARGNPALQQGVVYPGTNNASMTDNWPSQVLDLTTSSNNFDVFTSVGYELYTFAVNPLPATGTPLPSLPPAGNDCLVSLLAYTGLIEAGTWTFGLSAEAQIVSGGTVTICFRLYRSADPTASRVSLKLLLAS